MRFHNQAYRLGIQVEIGSAFTQLTLFQCTYSFERSNERKKKLFKNKIFCDIHVQGAQDIRSSVKYTKFFSYILMGDGAKNVTNESKFPIYVQ